MYPTYFCFLDHPAGDKGVLTNPVWQSGEDIEQIAMIGDLAGIHSLEREMTEIGFDDNFEIMNCGIWS